MYQASYFEIAYQFLSKKCYQKAIPYLFEAAQQGHPLAYLWIEDIYSHGLDGLNAPALVQRHKRLLPNPQTQLEKKRAYAYYNSRKEKEKVLYENFGSLDI